MEERKFPILKKQKKTMLSLSLFLLGSAVLLLHGCEQVGHNDEIQANKTNVTSEDVANSSGDVSKIIGKEVTIRNKVIKTIGDSNFVMNSDTGSPILVINATGAPFVIPKQDIPVQVTGTVESFVAADINKKYGLNLDPSLYVNYERKPAIVAKSFALAPTPEDLAQIPISYFDKTIAVKGQVRKLATSNDTPGSFALFEKGWADDTGILVVGVDRNLQGGPIQEGEFVVVTGEVRQPNANLLQQNLGWDANKTQEFLSRYKNRPVIVAKNVYPSAVP